jgi:hypothetical protein
MAEVVTSGPAPGREGESLPETKFKGDWGDDDGQAIDDYFAHPDLGPDADEKFDFSDFDTTPVTRFVIRTLPILDDMEPLHLLPRDTNRISVSIAVVCQTNGDFVWLRYSDSKSGSYDGAILSSENPPMSLPHNGDVWVHLRPGEAVITGVCYVTITSVTL